MNEVLIAVAGAGKTETIAQRVAAEGDTGRVFLLTYLVRNQLEDSARIAKRIQIGKPAPRVMGWFNFLLNEVVRPYSKLIYPDIEVRGLCTTIPKDFQYLSGPRRYFTTDGDVFSERISLLALNVLKAGNKSAVRRLESVADAIYIDEAQDLVGNDLAILEVLMRSKIKIVVVCDPRQDILNTSKQDRKYRKYKDGHIGEFFKELESKGLCALDWLDDVQFLSQMLRTE